MKPADSSDPQGYGDGGQRRTATLPSDPDDVEAACATAMNVLNGAAQSAQALERRLTRRGFSVDASHAAVERMREYGYVDDSALAASIAARRTRTGYGRMRVASDLRQRQIDGDVVDSVMGEIAVDDVDVALEIARRHWKGHFDDREMHDRQVRKVASFLQRRGYGHDTVRAVLRRLSAPD